jgi:hypothetical protein
MRQSEKMRWERILLDAFLPSSGLAVPEKIIHHDKPDFILNVDGLRLGLEITEIVTPLYREQEALRSRMLRLASDLWIQGGLPPLRASVYFNNQHPLRRSDMLPVAQLLVAAAQLGLPVEGEMRRIEAGIGNGRHLPNQVLSIGLACLPAKLRTHWVPSDSGFVPALTPEQLQKEIDRKERQRHDYSQDIEQCWLLLCVDGFCLSSMFDLDPACDDYPFTSGFDRVGCFDRGSSRTQWLRCVPVPEQSAE